jgi:arginyl-tRNA--protein-N-Asp/Glu arginylyltransferase
MSLINELPFAALQFYATAPYACSYLPGQSARSQVAAPAHLVNTDTYSKLVEQGFRRSGTFTYRPHCDQCQACLPLRVNCHGFEPNRSQRRTLKKHQHLKTNVLPLVWSNEHFELYSRYLAARHPAGGMDEDGRDQYSQFLLNSRVNSRLVEFRDAQETLLMVSIIDILDSGLSSVYTFFEPDDKTGLGTYSILWQIDQCRTLNLPWLYLGYWIKQSPKMVYKQNFRPAQFRQNSKWLDLVD